MGMCYLLFLIISSVLTEQQCIGDGVISMGSEVRLSSLVTSVFGHSIDGYSPLVQVPGWTENNQFIEWNHGPGRFSSPYSLLYSSSPLRYI